MLNTLHPPRTRLLFLVFTNISQKTSNNMKYLRGVLEMYTLLRVKMQTLL